MNKKLFLFLIITLIFIFNSEIVRANNLEYDYSSTEAIPIHLAITSEISTKNPINDGQSVEFRVLNDVNYEGKTIAKQGDIVPAKIATIVTAGMNGFPAEIFIDDFQFPNIKNSQLMGEYNKKGQNRCLWVYPLKWSLTLIPFVGSLTNFIMGGNAKIQPDEMITIYYYPKWK
ncbi:MAG: hypothetical protein LKG27_02370 [Clostridiaceae bacterium]|jgi:hypothetical protein|nr:hypothetical protein [Clostridiaceae bacterium]